MTAPASAMRGGRTAGAVRSTAADDVGRLPDIERALAWITSGFNLVYALTASAGFVKLFTTARTDGAVVVTALVLIPLVVCGVRAAAGRTTRRMWALSACCYAAATAVWAVSLTGHLSSGQPPWLLAMLIPAVLQALMATRSMCWTAVATAAYLGALACAESIRGGLAPGAVLTEFVMIAPFGLLLAAIVSLVRRSALRAARAQQATLQQVVTARMDDVTERERERTDALVHDTVLTTLLQAASAEGDDETDRAERMARNALRVLAHVRRTRELGTGVRLRSAVSAHEQHLDPAIRSFDVILDDHRLEDLLLPSDAADALLGALAEAMDNSVRHAAAVRRTVHLLPLGPDGVRIEVDDDGQGFRYPDLASNGIRSRIILPMRNVEGRAELTSASGRGTSVRLSWGSVSVTDVRIVETRLEEADA